ncbi:MAG: ABC transporter permease/substrate-binding protein [Gammaproteobacteria bacterium]|nr:ABC transporter permease/substrate-binding protein [Gammaproteobacteria bacterium]
MSASLSEQLEHLPEYMGAHMLLCGVALLLGLCISLPMALLVVRRPRAAAVVLGSAGVIQTIPSLALLALMVPLLKSFGFLPALVALVLYSMLPILRNTVTGISQVDPNLTEAANALGLTPGQMLRLVEIPLALPIIVAGVRTSAVWVVGIATLSTPVGQTSLGNYIFGGLQTRNWTAVMVGCVLAAALALLIDLLLALAERGARLRRPMHTVLGLGALVVVLVTGSLWPHLATSRPPDTRQVVAPQTSAGAASQSAPVTSVRVGAKTFTEQYILAALMERHLRAAGLVVTRADSLGSTVAFDALCRSEIDVYVDYSGTLWANAMKRQDKAPPWKVLAELAGWLADRHGVRLLGALGFENAYALAMRRDRATQLGIATVQDLTHHAPLLAVGSDYEFFQRPEWRTLQQTYGLAFRETVSFDSTFMYPAVVENKVDIITAFSSDGRIAAYDLVVLDDPRHAFPPYDAVVLLSPRVATDAAVVGALQEMLGRIDVAHMRQANLMVDRDDDKWTPDQAAGWLDEQTRRP